MHWCPRCRGVLLSPGPVDAPPERRNYRWVARRPDHRTRRTAATTRVVAPRTPTPHYTLLPLWGLRDIPPQPPAAPVLPFDRFTVRRDRLLLLTVALFGLASLSEYGRYLILLRNRTRLIPQWLLWFSDATVWLFGVLAPICALATAFALIGWLLRARRAAYEARGERDPRSMWSQVLGCLIPGVNLLWPGVFLTELLGPRPDPRTHRTVRIWWGLWLVSGLFVVLAVLWRPAGTLQAEADGVSFSAFTDLWAAGFALFTLYTVRMIEGRDLRGAARSAHRWVVGADPVEAVIAPVTPGPTEPVGPIERADSPQKGENSGAEHDRADREQEEVVAK